MIAPMAQRVQTPVAERGTETARRHGGRFAVVFAAGAVALTLVSLLLAVAAPLFNTSTAPTIPSGWRQIYDASLNASSPGWQQGAGCVLQSAGLHATGDRNGALCGFAPTLQKNLLGSGFELEVTLASAAAVLSVEAAWIQLGTSGGVVVDQFGHVAACAPTCSVAPQSLTTTDVFAWHGVAANTITLRWLGPGSQLHVYTDGQLALTIAFAFGSDRRDLQLGTPSNEEAIYTHLRLYSPA